FNASKISDFPLPDGASLGLATRLDGLAQEMQRVAPSAVARESVSTRDALDRARGEWKRIRGEMISVQEELDWEVYDLYGLLGDDADELIGQGVTKPPLALGERAFEIALARKAAAGEEETEWFTRHGSTPITELPEHWPADYRALVERRLAKIADDSYLHLIERPECKRRWAARSWEDMEADALRDWLLDRIEGHALWHRPAPTLRTVAQLADELRSDADFVSVAGLYSRDVDLGDVVAALVKDQHVPFLAAWRYTDSGLRVRKQWKRTWDLQRREDAGEKVGEIDVPPKYKQGDFRDTAFWRNRGKLDVPKERFISYPDASRDGTLLLGWAGWDHLQQAQALTTYVTERREFDAWEAGKLTPLLAGLGELLPWVAQWHPDIDPEFGVRPADAYTGFLDEQLLQLGLARDDLTGWRLPARTKKKTTKPAQI
ncbi:BREX-2 system adenine-specific DNA-methyltransferase PglX, partial [Candidatus Protofrankia californiensis]|uniref:BREX-2 system adenine-specific DNA-methyltransferase PglX n=1 Tax=Candidatus Protofrankia californiensis TaxID=1839754 RepID=UPI001041881B